MSNRLLKNALLSSLGSKREARSKRGEKEEGSLKGTLPAATAVPRASRPPSLYGWAEGRQMDSETILCTTWIHLGGYSLGTPWRERAIFAGILDGSWQASFLYVGCFWNLFEGKEGGGVCRYVTQRAMFFIV